MIGLLPGKLFLLPANNLIIMEVVVIVGVVMLIFAIVMTIVHNYLEKKETRKDHR